MNKELKEILKLWEEEYLDEDNKYNHDFHNIHLNSIKEFIGGNVIDIGCGAGRNIKYLSSLDSVKSVLGIDISGNAINQAKSRLSTLENVELLQTQLLNVKGNFDFFYDSSCYIHCDIETKKNYINWIKENANKNAKLAIVYPEWIGLWENSDEKKFMDNFKYIKTLITETEWGNLITKLFVVEN